MEDAKGKRSWPLVLAVGAMLLLVIVTPLVLRAVARRRTAVRLLAMVEARVVGTPTHQGMDLWRCEQVLQSWDVVRTDELDFADLNVELPAILQFTQTTTARVPTQNRERIIAQAVPKLQQLSGQDFGRDYDRWHAWLAAERAEHARKAAEVGPPGPD